MISSNFIIGAGKVGQALHYYFKDCMLFDKEETSTTGDVFYLHIAFPYDENFKNEVKRYINKYQPKMVIIHSTVKPGTTRELQKGFDCAIIYSPIIGQHNELEKSLGTFEKFITSLPENRGALKQVYDYFKQHDLKPRIAKEIPEELELGKLLATTRYALNIAFAQEQERICKKNGLEYDSVVLEFEKMFNEGSLKIGNIEHVRPFVFPGEIGGHCLMPNIDILKKVYKSEWFDLIEKSNEKKKKSH